MAGGEKRTFYPSFSSSGDGVDFDAGNCRIAWRIGGISGGLRYRRRPLERTTCRQVIVSCPGIKDLGAQLRVTQPGRKTRRNGGSGAAGTVGLRRSSGGTDARPRIVGNRFLVVDRAWDGGWVTQEGGLKLEACRYATLLTWIHETLHKGGKL